MNAKEQALREEICLIGRLMHQKQYIDGSAGNISARLDDNRILSTPSGLAKGFMSPDQLIIIDMDANRIDEPNDANRHLVPTSEVLMHLECYRQREDVQGVVHAHPQTAVALTLVGYDFRRCIIPETVIILGMVPTTPYATPASAENRDAIRNLIAEHDAIMLAHHGSLTVAGSVWDAYLRLETLEHSAKTLFMAAQLGGPRELPAHQVQKLLALRHRLGLERPGDLARFAEALGLHGEALS